MQIALGLGSNIGDAADNIRRASALLAERGLGNARLSRLYGTRPVGCVPGTPDFINAAVAGSWTRPLEDLLAACKQVEYDMGRPREHSSAESRVMDVDVLLAKEGSFELPGLRIPHPEAHRRLFVLAPLADIVPDWLVPQAAMTVAELLQQTLARHEGPPSAWLLEE
jgi:2-amino-4-hydroxy-6-hydroxymethyldihydropteridine diphosphokinase